MGPSSDPLAVVDASGMVHGIENITVVDASIMPTIPRANTNLPVLALAERIVSQLN
jgi:choline dehydrogenase-like flavoprotein